MQQQLNLLWYLIMLGKSLNYGKSHLAIVVGIPGFRLFTQLAAKIVLNSILVL
jgi:hypothetical protein